MSETPPLIASRAKAGGWWHAVPESWVSWDQRMFDELKAADRTTPAYAAVDALAHDWPGLVLILTLVGGLFYLRRKNLKGVVSWLLAFALLVVLMALGNFVSDQLKSLFARLKPHISFDVPGLKQPLSFPSNHSFNTATLIGYGIYTFRQHSRKQRVGIISILTLIWAFTAWSRIYLGEHFPVDVLGGLFFGLAYGFYGTWLLTKGLSWLGKRR